MAMWERGTSRRPLMRNLELPTDDGAGWRLPADGDAGRRLPADDDTGAAGCPRPGTDWSCMEPPADGVGATGYSAAMMFDWSCRQMAARGSG